VAFSPPQKAIVVFTQAPTLVFDCVPKNIQVVFWKCLFKKFQFGDG
jgi:hypothetical protein